MLIKQNEWILHYDRGTSDKIYHIMVITTNGTNFKNDDCLAVSYYGRRGKYLRRGKFKLGNWRTAFSYANELVESKTKKGYGDPTVEINPDHIKQTTSEAINFYHGLVDNNDEFKVETKTKPKRKIEKEKVKKETITKNVFVTCTMADGYDQLTQGKKYKLTSGSIKDDFITIDVKGEELTVYSERFCK